MIPTPTFRRNRLSVFLTHGWEARRRLAEKNERSARRWEFVGEARPVPNTHYRLARSRAPNGRKRPDLWAVHRSGSKWDKVAR